MKILQNLKNYKIVQNFKLHSQTLSKNLKLGNFEISNIGKFEIQFGNMLKKFEFSKQSKFKCKNNMLIPDRFEFLTYPIYSGLFFDNKYFDWFEILAVVQASIFSQENR